MGIDAGLGLGLGAGLGAGVGAGIGLGKAGAHADADSHAGSGSWSGSESYNTNSNFNGNLNLNGNFNASVVKVDLDLDEVAPDVYDNDGFDFDNIGDAVALSAYDYGVSEYAPTDNSINYTGSFDGWQSTNQVFDIDQANKLADSDTVYSAEVKNESSFHQDGYAVGGGFGASVGPGIGSPDGIDLGLFDKDLGITKAGAGDDATVAGTALLSADAMVNQEAFTQTIIQGANMQANTVDMTVVGGGSHVTSSMIGEDEA